MQPSSRFAALALSACLAGLAPAAAQAQSATRVVAPSVDALEVNADAGFEPGSTLDFTVRGTPRGQARVRVAGSPIDLSLQERAPGVYSGSYTVRRDDRLAASSLIHATVTAQGRSTASDFRFPSSFAGRQQVAAGPLAVQPPPPPARQVRIDRFEATPVGRAEPGGELQFLVEGVPGATVTVDWPGLQGEMVLREEQPGHYTGRYVIRPQDTAGIGPVQATLRSAGRRVTTQLAGPIVVAAPLPPIPAGAMGAAAASTLALQVTNPPPNAVVDAGQAVLTGRTAPGALVHVRVDAVPPAAPGQVSVAMPLLQQTVQADGNGLFHVDLGRRATPPNTRLEVQLSATQGNQTTPEQRIVLFQRG